MVFVTGVQSLRNNRIAHLRHGGEIGGRGGGICMQMRENRQTGAAAVRVRSSFEDFLARNRRIYHENGDAANTMPDFK